MEAFDEQENFKRFSDVVLADRKLHDQLRAAADEEAFIALAVRLGGEHGCVFTALVVMAALIEQRQAWLERWL